jgi:hypothetical protein
VFVCPPHMYFAESLFKCWVKFFHGVVRLCDLRNLFIFWISVLYPMCVLLLFTMASRFVLFPASFKEEVLVSIKSNL